MMHSNYRQATEWNSTVAFWNGYKDFLPSSLRSVVLSWRLGAIVRGEFTGRGNFV